MDSTGSIHVQDIPYSGFISWEKIFVNGWHLCVLRIKFSRIAIISSTHPKRKRARHAHAIFTNNIFVNWDRSANFLPRNIPAIQYELLPTISVV